MSENLKHLRVARALMDPSGGSDRRDFLSSHYSFTTTSVGIAIHSKTRPDVLATMAFWANCDGGSYETAVEPEGQTEVNTVLGVSKPQQPQQGKRK